MDSDPPLRFLTASLHVDYLKPTPIDITLEVRARVAEHRGRKVTVDAELYAGKQVCARGRVVTVQVPEHLLPQAS